MPTPTALIDFIDPNESGARTRLAFDAPRQVWSASTVEEVPAVLDAVERAAAQGDWCVGFVAYEAAPAFDPVFEVHTGDGPLAWFAAFEQAREWPAPEAGAYARLAWSSALGREGFDVAITRIHQAIAEGEIYQVNYTAALLSAFQGQPLALFRALHRAQPDGYAAYIDTGGMQVLSVSPELFFDWRDARLLGRPMKGTALRGATPQEDEARALALRTTEKERAENLMIVDLIRNDLSRVAEPFSVRVPRLFHTQPLPTVWQMTSDVEARTRPGTTLREVFGALFPCGSVTGAPKVRAMHWIRALESEARGVYCGAVGVVKPGGAATFNVPIRTVTVRDGIARCGIGSGITADASAEGEWAEWSGKRAFLELARQPFELLETLRLEEGRCLAAEAHLARMAGAARHFGYPWEAARVQAALAELAAAHAHGSWRVRLLLDSAGTPHAEAQPMPATPSRVKVCLAASPIEAPALDFLRFKTTRREHYDRYAPVGQDVFDTLLYNAAGELTEFTRGNVAVQLDGRWVTPPLGCGLLGGVARAQALQDGRLSEAVVHVDDLARAQGLAFVNSLRGWIDADLQVQPAAQT
ncbi:aminodeoxychorismate synthase component I [Schlegelella sp. S2-27]|uniref:Aminodeoxychorismate synthase component I n=1 Tax=Caldimonas mangrovi TaxID=2944811 RepID=A0ABT0YHZ1_9BURK|nr:aminodeoxychorismate synthase component I [Caldimonas mangrovi]MCM5678342.1 aminodeoxychorismate synthase component I [Caldimonas mangrovi]